MNPATPAQIKEIQWAYDAMGKGVLYALYLGEEMIPHKTGEKIKRGDTNQRISPNTGRAFICMAYFCEMCGDFYIAKKKQLSICNDCMKIVYRKKLRDETKAKNKGKSNKNKKVLMKKRVEKHVSCCGCANLFIRSVCNYDECSSQGYKDRIERM